MALDSSDVTGEKDERERPLGAPLWCVAILSASVGVQAVAPAYPGVGTIALVAGTLGLLMAIAVIASRTQRTAAFRIGFLPTVLALIAVAAFVLSGLGVDWLTREAAPPWASWSLGSMAALVVACCLIGANERHRRRENGAARKRRVASLL
ncbi:hypothetical protein ATY41_10485 [Leifsonia xyli subsp. xyli]|nr:hypothetical protein [Leifsonia xyli]ODA90254.1 hypothetical protein ATY41_10485 [Leifsonia xyli subsp. xyli]